MLSFALLLVKIIENGFYRAEESCSKGPIQIRVKDIS